MKPSAPEALRFFLLLGMIALISSKKIQEDKVFTITDADKPVTYSGDYTDDDRTNEFKIKIKGKDPLLGQRLFLILESDNSDFYLNVWGDSKRNHSSDSLKAGSYDGNVMFVLGSGYFNNRLEKSRKSGTLYFGIRVISKIKADDKENGKGKFKLTIVKAKDVTVPFGKTFTAMIDSTVNLLPVKLQYDGTANEGLAKLRFQVSAIRTKPKWQLNSSVQYKEQKFMMNPIFGKVVGGVLSDPTLPVCKEKECEYTMTISVVNVHQMNIESFLLKGIEKLSISHYEDYYDKSYLPNSLTLYELPYIKDMKGLDISISLVSSTGATDLYVNVGTLPNTLTSYDFKEEGQMAKRITIMWRDLVTMQAMGNSLYIAVRSIRPGEYLIKVDALEEGFRGHLNPGVTESGKVFFNEIANYVYSFEVIQDTKIVFDVKNTVTTGNTDLFLLPCSDFTKCIIEATDIDTGREGLIQQRESRHEKIIKHEFTCKKGLGVSASICQFAIAILGKENLASFYELSVSEEKFHRLMIPGHSMTFDLPKDGQTYTKLSFPSKNSPDSKLYLSIETLYGDYDMFLSKIEQYPNKDFNDMQMNFKTQTSSLYSALKSFPIDPVVLSDQRLEGNYFLAFKSKAKSQFTVRFYEQSGNELSIHMLRAGTSDRYTIRHSEQLLYFTLPVSLDDIQTRSLMVSLVPLKGHYLLTANRNGILPTPQNNEFFSENHRLELNTDKMKPNEEFLIGVSLHNPEKEKGKVEGEFQFMLTVSYLNRPVVLKPGIFFNSVIQDMNLYMIEIGDDFRDLLILKSAIDGFNIQMCGHFTTTEAKDLTIQRVASCDYSAHDKNVALYIKEETLRAECKKVVEASSNHAPKCHFVLSVTGIKGQKLQVGFTYNDHAFQLIKNSLVDGPFISHPQARINFVYHAQAEKEVGLYFNSKGRRLNMFTRLVSADKFDESMTVNFPDQANHDEKSVTRMGYVQNVYYTRKEVSEKGDNPELLISILPDEATTASNEKRFDGRSRFILQTAMDTIELLRTQNINQQLQEGEWFYYWFYNNGNSDKIKIYIMSTVNAPLQAVVSRGLTARPPLNAKPLIKKEGISSLELAIETKDLRTSPHQNEVDLRGEYLLGIKSTTQAMVSVYWNNKEDLNFIELTPNEPTNMILDADRKFYFTFYAQDADSSDSSGKASEDRKDIKLYFKLDVRANIFLIKSRTGELEVPSDSNLVWKASTGPKGGVTMIHIEASDVNYCVECLYIGHIETDDPGEVNMLVNLEHANNPMRLLPGFTFPEYLVPKTSSKFRLFNQDANTINVTVSMITGFVNVYIGLKEDVSQSNFSQMYSLEEGLNTHKFIQIEPHKMGVATASEWFILVDNPKASEAAFTLSIDKNNQQAPLEPGITKFIHLGPGEGTDFFYRPSADESEFEVRVELSRVMVPNFKEQALGVLSNFLSVHEVVPGGQNLSLALKSQTVSENRVFATFELPRNSGKTFGIRVFNPVSGSAVAVKLDLLTGGFKLVNFNSYHLGTVSGKESMLFEAYGGKGKFVFVDVKKCIGHPKVSFFQDDYQNVEVDQQEKFKRIKDENSFIQYVKVDKKRVFIKVENKKGNFTSFIINVFNEKDMDNNPFTDIVQQGEGRVEVETENQRIRFKPINLNKSLGKEFINEVTYSVFLSPSMKVMRYGKNCGRFGIEKAFKKPDLRMFSHVIKVDHQTVLDSYLKKPSRLDDFLRRGYIEVNIDGLDKNKKYYGVVVAEFKLLPDDEGVLTALRTGRAYYDEFTVITPRLVIPTQLIIGCLVILAFLCGLFLVVKAYIFGDIRQIHKASGQFGTKLEEVDDDSTGVTAFTMLEKAYYEEKRRVELERRERDVKRASQAEKAQKKIAQVDSNDSLEDHCQEIEMSQANDREQPLDLEA